MCKADDEVYALSESGDSDPFCGLYVIIILTLLVSLTALALASYEHHVNKKQEHEIQGDLDPATKVETVISTTVELDYFFSIYDRELGYDRTEHIPINVLNTKRGPPFEKSHCIIHKNSPFGEMFITKQFDIDMRTINNTVSYRYSYIEFRFETPFGNILDGKNGDNYPGYVHDTDSELEEGANDSNKTKLNWKKGKCGVPYCPDYVSLYGYNKRNIEHDIVVDKFILNSHEVFEMIAYHEPASSFIEYTERIPQITSLSCGCTNEYPPRFQCRIPAHVFQHKQGHFGFDVSFRYLLKPTTKTTEHP